MPPPGAKQVRYLHNPFLERVLNGISDWVLNRKALVYGLTALMLVGAGIGILRLKNNWFVVDDLPKKELKYIQTLNGLKKTLAAFYRWRL